MVSDGLRYLLSCRKCRRPMQREQCLLSGDTRYGADQGVNGVGAGWSCLCGNWIEYQPPRVMRRVTQQQKTAKPRGRYSKAAFELVDKYERSIAELRRCKVSWETIATTLCQATGKRVHAQTIQNLWNRRYVDGC